MRAATGLLVLGLVGAVLLAACGGDSAPASSPTTAQKNAVASPTATGPAAVTTAVKAANEGPRVLWMLREHAGPGLITVRFVTDVETTAVLSMAPRAGDFSTVEPQEDRAFATVHTISIPLGERPAFASVEVTDRKGRKGTGALEYRTVVSEQYWSGGSTAPKVQINQGTVLAIWTNRRGELSGKGTVQLFAKKPGCTTADACQAEPAGIFAADAPQGGATFETHTIPFKLDSLRDWRVLITAPVIVNTGGALIARFYQVDVAASELK